MVPKITKKPGSRRARASERGAPSTTPAVKKLNIGIDFRRESQKSNAWKVETVVICTKCKKKFKSPFKPRRPDIYCDECFKKMPVVKKTNPKFNPKHNSATKPVTGNPKAKGKLDPKSDVKPKSKLRIKFRSPNAPKAKPVRSRKG